MHTTLSVVSIFRCGQTIALYFVGEHGFSVLATSNVDTYEHRCIYSPHNHKQLTGFCAVQHSFMEAICKTSVVCPLVSVPTLQRMQELKTTDTCDNVLLEWWCAVVIKSVVAAVEAGTASPELTAAVKAKGKVHLQRVYPLFLSNAWSNSLMQKGQLDADAQGYLFELKDSLPSVVSQQTRTTLIRFLQPYLGLSLDGIPELSFTVKQVVSAVFSFDAMMCWDAVDATLVKGHGSLVPYNASTKVSECECDHQ